MLQEGRPGNGAWKLVNNLIQSWKLIPDSHSTGDDSSNVWAKQAHSHSVPSISQAPWCSSGPGTCPGNTCMEHATFSNACICVISETMSRKHSVKTENREKYFTFQIIASGWHCWNKIVRTYGYLNNPDRHLGGRLETLSGWTLQVKKDQPGRTSLSLFLSLERPDAWWEYQTPGNKGILCRFLWKD